MAKAATAAKARADSGKPAAPRDTSSEQRSVTFPVRDAKVQVGAKLRALRQARGLSIEQVAQAVGVNKSFISKLEHDIVAPSVATLLRYCDAVGIRAGTLFDPPPTKLVRRGDGQPIDLGGQHMREFLVSGEGQDQLMALLSEIEPGGGSGDEPYTLRSAADVVHVLEGRLEMIVDGVPYILTPGDTLTFPPTLPHTWRNPSRTTRTRAFWVIVPPP
jgi:transcriptional regulator with XRE-family HTH domain